jgi:hypothetical protein
LAQLDPGQVRRVLETGVLASSGRLDDLERRARTAVFRAGFDYAAVEPSVGADAANLNGGMIDRIGTFAGPLPAAGDTADDPAELITFDDGPAGGRVMKLDRAVADGALTAQLAEPVHLHGATVGFDIATRRTGGVDDRRKDFDIVGFDAANREAFHLRVNTAPNLARLAAVVEGAVEISKLTDTFGGVGADSAGDLPFTPADPTQSGALGTVTLSMTPAGYSIHFVRGHQTYATGLIQYNGAARTLSRIEFQFRGSDDVNAQSGFFLDNLSVDGIPVDGP